MRWGAAWEEPVRIGIEGKVLTRRIGGVGRCAINWLRALVALAATARPDLDFVVFTGPQTDLTLVRGLNATICHRLRHLKSSLLRASFGLPAGVVMEGIDLFHGLDESGIPFFLKRGRYVATVHDVLPLEFPSAFPLRHRLVSRLALSRVARQADRVIVPSVASKTAVLRHLQVDERQVVVIPLGCEERFHPAVDAVRMALVRQRYRLPERYILFLGTLEPRKDAVTLLRAFALWRNKPPAEEVKLVIAGGRGWGYPDVLRTCKSLRLDEAVLFTGFIDEEDLPDLYRGAELFVYPSLSEGFGLPILEAMACGVPVITSNVSSMPEVAGQAAVLIEPREPEALAAAIASVLSDEALRGWLREQGLGRAKAFSWPDVARRTLDLYADLL
jgi:glycosyltransferase involved in cell wall biosynthesis